MSRAATTRAPKSSGSRPSSVEAGRRNRPISQLVDAPAAPLGQKVNLSIRFLPDPRRAEPRGDRKEDLRGRRVIDPGEGLEERLALRGPHAVPLLQVLLDTRGDVSPGAGRRDRENALLIRRASPRLGELAAIELLIELILSLALVPLDRLAGGLSRPRVGFVRAVGKRVDVDPGR